MLPADWPTYAAYVLDLEREGLVTRTFRRLDPERQAAILTAILDEAAQKGPTDLNIKHVAERASVSVGALYTYFGSRDGLLNFTVALCVRAMNDALNSIRPYLNQMTFAEALTVYIRGGLEMNDTHRGLFRFFARAAYHSESDLSERVVRPIAVTMRQVVRDMLTAAAVRGELRPDVDLDATARIVHALTIVYGDALLFPYLNAYFQISDSDVTPERALDALIALVLTGIGAPALRK